MIEPHVFVRAVTFGLGTTWTLLALRRLVHFERRWRSRFALLGLADHWWNRQLRLLILRTTLLDPINLALLCLLVAVWSLRLAV